MRPLEARRVGPRTLPAEAVLAVIDRERSLVVGQDDVYDLPVALVCLPDEVARRVLVRVDVVVVEVPVLEYDPVVLVDDAAINGRAAAPLVPRRREARQSPHRGCGRTGGLVQPPEARPGRRQGPGPR